jgi:hypothetical protein
MPLAVRLFTHCLTNIGHTHDAVTRAAPPLVQFVIRSKVTRSSRLSAHNLR